MSLRKGIAILLLVVLGGNSTACMSTVTRYRDVTVPEVQTKYRTVKKPVEKEVAVPYAETVTIPQYRTIRQSVINPSGSKLTVAFLPLSASTGAAWLGIDLSQRFEKAVREHEEAAQKYEVVTQDRVAAELGKSDLSDLEPGDLRKIIEAFQLDRLVSGNIRSRNADNVALRFEVIDANSKEIRYTENMNADIAGVVRSVLYLFYGVKQRLADKVETITKYRTERVTEYVDETEPYQETVMVSKKEAYEAEEIDWLNTLLLIGIIVAASSPKK